MRIALGIFEVVLWLLAVIGFAVGVFIMTVGYKTMAHGDQAQQAVGLLVGFWYALPALTLGAASLGGAACLAALGRILQRMGG